MSTRREHRLFLGATALLLGFVFIGFARTFFLKVIFGTPRLPLYLHLHGLALTTWFALLVVQVGLVSRQRTDVHRRLGIGGLGVAAAVVATGALASARVFSRHVGLEGSAEIPRLLAEDGPIIFGNFAILIFFATTIGLAAYFRRRPAIHKRLMLVASVSIVGPAIDRLWLWTGTANAAGIFGPLTLLTVVAALIAWDWRSQKRAPRVLIAGFVVMIIFGFSGTGLGTTAPARSWLLSTVDQPTPESSAQVTLPEPASQ